MPLGPTSLMQTFLRMISCLCRWIFCSPKSGANPRRQPRNGKERKGRQGKGARTGVTTRQAEKRSRQKTQQTFCWEHQDYTVTTAGERRRSYCPETEKKKVTQSRWPERAEDATYTHNAKTTIAPCTWIGWPYNQHAPYLTEANRVDLHTSTPSTQGAKHTPRRTMPPEKIRHTDTRAYPVSAHSFPPQAARALGALLEGCPVGARLRAAGRAVRRWDAAAPVRLAIVFGWRLRGVEQTKRSKNARAPAGEGDGEEERVKTW